MIQLNPGERIYLLRRRHRIILRFKLFPFCLFFALTLILILTLLFKKISWPQFFIENFPWLSKFKLKFLLIFLLSLILPILWVSIFFFILSYYLTYWVITNQRTIFVEFLGLFNVEYGTVYHDKIQDILIHVKGILPSIFHFGDLRIQSAGEKGQFLLNDIPEPEIVKKVILEAKMDYERKLEK